VTSVTVASVTVDAVPLSDIWHLRKAELFLFAIEVTSVVPPFGIVHLIK